MPRIMKKKAIGRPKGEQPPIEITSFRLEDSVKARLDAFAKETKKVVTPAMVRYVNRSTALNDILGYFFQLQDKKKVNAASVQDALRKPA